MAAPLADKTPQAQLGLRRTPVSGQPPPTGSTDGGTSGTSGGWFLYSSLAASISPMRLYCFGHEAAFSLVTALKINISSTV
jgi:hypothetical protein